MESDGSLTATHSQNSFARNYNDGVGQGSAADALAILDEPDVAAATEETRVAAMPKIEAGPWSVFIRTPR